jgi:hypothetical protein
MDKLMSREDLLELLEYPLGEDNMLPRMHSKAKGVWRGNIMEVGSYIMNLERENKMLKQLLDSQALASHPIFNNKYTPPEGIAALVEGEE